MPPRRATPGKPRAITGLELDHPGPAWAVTGSRRGTPAKARARAADDDDPPKPKSAKKAKSPAKSPVRAVTPKSPAAAAGKRTKTPAKSPKAAKVSSAKSPIKSPAKSPKAASPARGKSPAKSPIAKSAAKPAKAAAAKSPTSSAKRQPKPVPESTAQSARKQLAEAGLGEYWTASGSRRKPGAGKPEGMAHATRSASPAPARPGDVPPGYEDDEPITSVGGGWLVNKVLLSCIICTLASAIEQGYRTGAVAARPLAVFALWGMVSGLVSSLWAKVLGWATESLQVGLPRTIITIAVDQLVMAPFMAAAFVSFVCLSAGMAEAAIVKQVKAHFFELILAGIAFWLGAFFINPNVPPKQHLLFCRIEQLTHAGYLASVAAKLTA